VEDSDRDFYIIKILLKEERNIHLSRAEGVREAITQLQKETFNLLFLDYDFQDGTGFDLLIEMGKKGIDIPVVVITGSGDEMLASKIIQAGAYDYIPKSKLREISLAQVINNTLQRACLKNDLKKLHARMVELSTLDPLTQLPNRRYFDEALQKEFERASRHKTEGGLIMIDVDHFKDINDTYGHLCGDIVLKETGKLLNNQKRVNDLVCRYGGEEFAVFLPNTDMDGLVIYCEKIRRTVEKHIFRYQLEKLHITISLGFTSSVGAESPREMIAQADKALYQAKEKGRNRVAAYKGDER
jgi:two-component system cell cycle response regulator